MPDCQGNARCSFGQTGEVDSFSCKPVAAQWVRGRVPVSPYCHGGEFAYKTALQPLWSRAKGVGPGQFICPGRSEALAVAPCLRSFGYPYGLLDGHQGLGATACCCQSLVFHPEVLAGSNASLRKALFMALYEHVFLVRQDVSAQQVEALTKEFSSVITEAGGSVPKSEYWGLKSLTYKIKKNRKAHFTLLNIDSAPEAVAEMERRMNLATDIIRHMTLRVDEHESEPSVMMRKSDRDERGGRGGPRGGRGGDRGPRPPRRDS